MLAGAPGLMDSRHVQSWSTCSGRCKSVLCLFADYKKAVAEQPGCSCRLMQIILLQAALPAHSGCLLLLSHQHKPPPLLLVFTVLVTDDCTSQAS